MRVERIDRADTVWTLSNLPKKTSDSKEGGAAWMALVEAVVSFFLNRSKTQTWLGSTSSQHWACWHRRAVEYPKPKSCRVQFLFRITSWAFGHLLEYLSVNKAGALFKRLRSEATWTSPEYGSHEGVTNKNRIRIPSSPGEEGGGSRHSQWRSALHGPFTSRYSCPV